MSYSTVVAGAAALCILIACEARHEPIALTKIRRDSDVAMQRSGISPAAVASLTVMHRMAKVERSIVAFEHWVYEEDAGPDDIYKQSGHMVLLGEKDGVTVGLATRCCMDWTFPRYKY